MRYFIWIALLFLGACQKEVIEIEPLGSSYFPMETGVFVSYNVKETVYAVNKQPQTIRYQIKDLISESFQTSDKQTAYRITRYKRANGIENWTILASWSCQKNGSFALRQEFNIPIVVLSFPLQENKTWNGNAYNNLEARKFEMSKVEQPAKIGTLNFEKTVQILQRNDSSLVDKYFASEIYAQNVGLVYKKTEDIIYCQTANCFGKNIIESGKIIEMSVFDFGKQK